MASSHHAARWPGRGKRSVQAGVPASAPTQPVFYEPPAPPPAEPEPAPELFTEPEQEPEYQEPFATDAAKQLADEHGIDLATVTGSGAEGRITKDDVAALIPDAGD